MHEREKEAFICLCSLKCHSVLLKTIKRGCNKNGPYLRWLRTPPNNNEAFCRKRKKEKKKWAQMGGGGICACRRDPDHGAVEEDESASEAEATRASWVPSFCGSFWADPAETICDQTRTNRPEFLCCCSVWLSADFPQIS